MTAYDKLETAEQHLRDTRIILREIGIDAVSIDAILTNLRRIRVEVSAQ